MKRLLAVFTSVLLALSLTACDVNINIENPSTTTTTTKVEQTQRQKKTKKKNKTQKLTTSQKATQIYTEPPVTTQKETHAPKTQAPTTVAKTTASTISRDKAKQIALSHAGVNSADIFDFEIELDRERGKLVYEISFDTRQKEYEYEILASTGEVLRSHSERQDRD